MKRHRGDGGAHRDPPPPRRPHGPRRLDVPRWFVHLPGESIDRGLRLTLERIARSPDTWQPPRRGRGEVSQPAPPDPAHRLADPRSPSTEPLGGVVVRRWRKYGKDRSTSTRRAASPSATGTWSPATSCSRRPSTGISLTEPRVTGAATRTSVERGDASSTRITASAGDCAGRSGTGPPYTGRVTSWVLTSMASTATATATGGTVWAASRGPTDATGTGTSARFGVRNEAAYGLARWMIDRIGRSSVLHAAQPDLRLMTGHDACATDLGRVSEALVRMRPPQHQ